MEQYQNVFARKEIKYLLDEEQYRRLYPRLLEYMRPDAYGETTISNLYLDTPDRRLIRASMEKPVYKEKLRLRAYGTPQWAGAAFVELKKKYRGVVYKRRAEMPLAEAMDFLAGRRPAGEGQIEREIAWTLQYYPNLRPRMFLSYERVALRGREEPDLRLTLDRNILWREEALDLTRGAWGNSLTAPGQRLMEIKLLGGIPLWLCRALDEGRIFPTSFSKYARAYLEANHRCEEEGIFCA